MAAFNVKGLEDAEREILRGGALAEKAIPLMIDTGVDVLIRAQQEAAARLNLSGRSKGALVKSIQGDKLKGSDALRYREVYPHGVDKSHSKKGVRNAEKGFVLEYGRSNMPATHWMSAANAAAADDVAAAELAVWEGLQGGS